MEHPRLREVLSKAAEKRDSFIIGLAEKYGYRPYMIARYLEMLGKEETLLLLEGNQTPLPKTIRCNDYLIPCNELEDRLERKGFVLTPIPSFSPYGYKVEKAPISVGATHEYLLGYYFVQGAASMSIVHAMDLNQGTLILDMAAAPGGKSTQILQLTRDRSLLVSVEKNKRRIRALRANLQRMGFKNYIIYHADNRQLPFESAFHSILLDAPSTGEGIIRKDPKRKQSKLINDIIFIHSIQVEMLLKAIQYARRGSSIVYAACSLAPEEGEMVIDFVLSKIKNIKIEEININASRAIQSYFGVEFNPEIRKCKRFWPHREGFEGFFVCKVRKIE